MGRETEGQWTLTCPHPQAAVGIPLLALQSLTITFELPTVWILTFVIGQCLGLLTSVISSLLCGSVLRREAAYHCTYGTICPKCHEPRLADSYHCDVCCMCVDGYSHHSIWLNTCIGTANERVYLVCVAGLAVAALCQVSADVALMVLMLSDREFTLYLNDKYSLLDQGFLFRLLLPFCCFVSFSIAVATSYNFSFHLCRVFAKPNSHKNLTKIEPIQPISPPSPTKKHDISFEIAGEDAGKSIREESKLA